MSSKILKEALIQQKGIQEETDAEQYCFSARACQSDNQSEINEDEERLLEVFFSKDARPQHTLAEIIVEKIKEKDQVCLQEFNLCPNWMIQSSRYIRVPYMQFERSCYYWKCSSKSLYSTPPLHSSRALMKLVEMEYGGTTSYFIKLEEICFTIPSYRCDGYTFHEILLGLEGYACDLASVAACFYAKVTPEILRELNHSRNRREEANGSFDSRLARSQRQHHLDFWP
ncbi:putative bystin [Helianthus debilis subsp. tardiflorus]